MAAADPTTRTGPGVRRPQIGRLYRLQWEAAQQAWVLLFPEGMIKLNPTAGEILRRCDGARAADDIIADLEATFAAPSVRADVEAFLALAVEKGWVEWRPGAQS